MNNTLDLSGECVGVCRRSRPNRFRATCAATTEASPTGSRSISARPEPAASPMRRTCATTPTSFRTDGPEGPSGQSGLDTQGEHPRSERLAAAHPSDRDGIRSAAEAAGIDDFLGASHSASRHGRLYNYGTSRSSLGASIFDHKACSINEPFRSSLDRATRVAVTGEAPGPLLM